MTSRRPWAAFALAALVGGCTSGAREAGAPAAATGELSVTTDALPEPVLAGSAEQRPDATPAAAPPAHAGTPVLATDSAPAGVEPLDAAEAKELGSRCKPLTDAVAAAARGDRAGGSPFARVLRVLAHPPAVAGVDVPRCAGLMERAVRADEARAVEAEPIVAIRRIVFGLSSALAGDARQLCPSAPPVPAELRQLEAGAYRSSAADWQAEGWRCARFDLVGTAQRYQYELRTDAATGSYEIVARGYPVAGHGQSELYLRGKVEGGEIQPTSAVYRR